MNSIYYKDDVILNMNNVSKIDASRGKKAKGWPITFYNSDVKIITRWDFESEQERNDVYAKIKYILEAVEL